MTIPPDLTRHTRRYWLIDGLPELFVGAFFLLFSGVQFAVRFVSVSVVGFVQLLIPALLLIVSLGGRWALQTLKTHTTYPHTGYVEYPKLSWWKQTLGILVGLVLGALVIFWSFNAPLTSVMLPVVTGALVALIMLYVGFYLGARRFYLLAALSLLTGLGVTLLPLDSQVSYLLIFAVLGLWMLVSGARTFWQYRRTYAAQG